MKLEYTIFGIKTTHEAEGYTVHWWSERGGTDIGSHNNYTTMFYAWAVYQGWRRARMYARMEGVNNHYAVFKGSEFRGEYPKRMRTIEVHKTVAFFSK